MPAATLEAPPSAPAIPSPAPPQPQKPATPSSPKPPTPGPAPATPPKSAMAQAGEDMEKFTKPAPGEQKKQETTGKRVEEKPDKPATDDEKLETKLETKTDDAKPAVAEPVKEGKVWKILKQTEIERDTIKKEYEAFKAKAQIDPEKEKATTEKLTNYEKRHKELVEELQFHNYEKHNEDFKKNYDEPYKVAWQTAVEEIVQLPVTTVDGTTRAGTAEDLMRLVNLNPVDAHEMAETMFGKFASDALSYRKEVRRTFDQRTRALETAKKTIGEKEKILTEQRQNQHREMSEFAGKTWKEADAEAFAHERFGQYFIPRDGETEDNQRLSKGRSLAERAFSESPFDPKLTPSERATIIKRQNAVCNRAAAFGRLVSYYEKSKSRVAELEKELSEFKKSDPGNGEGNNKNGQQPMTATQRWEDDLSRLAK